MERLHEQVWRLDDADGCTAYLVVGREKAYMIDTGMGRTPLTPQIRAVTSLPVELLLTHAHYDHYAGAREFDRVWLSEAEREALPELEQFFAERAGVAPLDRRTVRFFTEGTVFDAGVVQLRAIALPGHTPGSCTFGSTQIPALFVGDAIGGGIIALMAIPGALSIGRYRDALRAFERKAAAFAGMEWYGGHCRQAGQPGSTYNPPRMQMVRDLATLCDRLLTGESVGHEVDEINAPEGRALRADYGCAGLVYRKEQLTNA